MTKKESGILRPNEHIKRILKLPEQDFMTIEYESGERRYTER